MDDQYLFDILFQAKILALCLKDPKLVSSYRTVLNSNYFENPIHQNLCQIVLEYHDKYHQLPTLEALKQQISELKSLKDDIAKNQYFQELATIYQVEVPDRDYIVDKAIEFAKHQALKIGILKSVDHLQRGDYAAVSREIEEARKVGENALDIGRLYVEQHDIPFREPNPDRITRDYCPTMWKTLDTILRGGLYKKQLGVFMAPPKSGKSTALVNVGAAAVQLGRKVFHYTLELEPAFISERYDARITGINIGDLTNRSEDIKAKLATIRSRQGEVILKEYPTKTLNTRMIRSHLSHVQSIKGYLPDLIIVDYGDLMRSVRKVDDSYAEMGAVYEELRALAQEYDVPVWTATQSNRGGFNKAIVTLDDVSMSLEKVMVADIIVSLCQTGDEKKRGEMRLFVAGGRVCESERVIPCKVDFRQMIIRES